MLREKFPEFCSSPSPPIEGKEQGGCWGGGIPEHPCVLPDNLRFPNPLPVKIEEPVSMEMENHMAEKDDSCYDNAEAAFSDDEEDLNSKGEEGSSCITSAAPSLQCPAGTCPAGVGSHAIPSGNCRHPPTLLELQVSFCWG